MRKAATIGSGIFLSIGGFLFGHDSGIITSTNGQPTFVEYLGTPDAATTGGIVAAFPQVPFLALCRQHGLILGRKKTIFVGGCISGELPQRQDESLLMPKIKVHGN